ncbi:class A beta-lactamase, subclass A2 [Dyadobacter sp. CY323]|uniref:class A beta-lactamase, subclass A2 n=1 Tax=Dyadobacter sp. CY323 TaxID=2907302 RepID=UPI001EFF2E3B|nr:class A beta-lactamase, subclass A2 [Dyadobacter sp. CY323]
MNSEIETISKAIDGITGVGILDLKTKETVVFNGNHRFPMQSVFKFPLGIAVLDQVDKKKLRLDQKIHITSRDYFQKTYSPMRDKFPNADVDLTVAELLTYTVSLSDNIACDILFRLIGGPKVVNTYIHGLGVKDMQIVANEEQMHQSWDVQYTNWCKPEAMLQLLDVFYQGKKLSEASTDFLWNVMVETPTGAKRIKSMLPPNTIVAHKTGTSGANDKGITGAVNDVGIVKLPGGKDIAVVIYVSDSHAKTEEIEIVIAKIAKAAADHYSAK